MENKSYLIKEIQDRLNAVSVDKRKKFLLLFIIFFLVVFAIRIVNSINDFKRSSESVDTIKSKNADLFKMSAEDSSKMKVLELELQQYEVNENLDKFINDLVEKDRKSIEQNKKINDEQK